MLTCDLNLGNNNVTPFFRKPAPGSTTMNRRQRRAKGLQTATLESADDIPLARPGNDGDGTRGKTKTLYEIAAERQAQMSSQGQGFSAVNATKENVKYVKITPDGKTVEVTEDGKELAQSQEEAPTPVLDSLFLASSLSALHFTLDVLTVHQYAEKLRLPPIFLNTLLVVFPTLVFLVHLLHGHLLGLPNAALSQRTREFLSILQQGMFIATANVAGCYLIHLTNDRGYYAVMKKAPSVGTVWVWSVLELGLMGSLAGVTGPGIYAWYHGHSIW